MPEKIWIGAIYLKDEGGYEIVLKSLKHYKNRLKTLGNSPELKDAGAMFGPVLYQQAMKTIPKKTLYRDEHLTIQQLIHQVFEAIRHDKDFEIIFPTILSYLGITMPKNSLEK